MKSNLLIPRLTSQRRFIIALFVIIAICACLSLTDAVNLNNEQNIVGVDSLSGQRIGCCVAWETDFLLSERKDIDLLRYDTNADAILALGFHQVDAIGVDETSYSAICQKVTGIEIVPEPIAKIKTVIMGACDDVGKALMDEFNGFIEDFSKTEEFEDYCFRGTLKDGKEFRSVDIPRVENGPVINVGYIPECYPESFINLQTKEPEGYGIEIILRFAYAYGYKVEFVECSEVGFYNYIETGKISLGCAYMTDVYRKEIEYTGNALMSVGIISTDVYILKMKPGEKLVISGIIEE